MTFFEHFTGSKPNDGQRHTALLRPAGRLLTILSLAFLTVQPAWASCTGKDLWTSLPSAKRAELEKVTARDVFASGRYFKVTKNGKTSYLFGTMHAPPVGTLRIPNLVIRNLRKSKTLLVEVTSKEETDFFGNIRKFGSQFMSAVPTKFNRHFNSKEWRFVESVTKSAGLESKLLEHARPWYVYLQMSSLGCESGRRRGQDIMDASLEKTAHSAGLRVVGLETPLNALQAMQGFKPEQYAQMIRAEVWGYRHSNAGDMYVTRMNMYRRGDIQMIWQFQMLQFAPYKNPKGAQLVEKLWEKQMLKRRNKAWMPKILEAFKKGDAFVAIGALHLGGKYGLMQALQRKGYAITRYKFTS